MEDSSGAQLGSSRRVGWLVLALAVATFGVAACGGDDGDDSEATTTPATDAAVAEAGEKIVIATHIEFPPNAAPKGEILVGSTIGDSPFCQGGSFGDTGGTGTWTVEKTLDCPDGTLTIGFSPGRPVDHVQSGPWKVLAGTGALANLNAKGEMEVTGSAGEGRETFTGTVEP